MADAGNGDIDPATPHVHRFAARTVGAVAGTVAVVHTALASVPRRWFDEDLVLAIGRYHLDLGAVDQPPLTPLLARLADTIAPGSQIVLAAPAVLATAGAVVMTALMARELGGDARAQTLAALAQGTCVAAAQFGHWLTPYTLEPALWAVIFWLLLRWTRVRDDRLLLVLGVAVGVTAQTRLQVLALAAVVPAAVALLGPRTLLRRPAFWGGAAIALSIMLPTLTWQAARGWPQLAMAGAVATENTRIYGGPLLVALHGLAVVGPLTLGIAAVGLVALLRRPEWTEHRYLAVTFLVLFAALVVGGGRHYYPIPLYGVLVAFGVVALQRRREAGRTRIAWPVVAVGTVVAVTGAATSVALASPRLGDAVVSATALAYRELPAADRSRTAVGATPYVYATFLDAAAPGTGLPPAVSTNRAYGWFGPPPQQQDRLLLVGDPALLRPHFAGIRPAGRVDAPTPLGTYGGLVPETTGIWLLSGRTTPWEQIWHETRDLSVTPG